MMHVTLSYPPEDVPSLKSFAQDDSVCMYVHVCTCMCMCVRVCACVYVHVCVYVYVHMCALIDDTFITHVGVKCQTWMKGNY